MKASEMAIPDLFRCPISLDLFTDPVTLCTGQTYDRSSIEKWLSLGNLTCPVTMQKLHDPSMIPNHTLRHLIDQWLQMGPQSDPSYCYGSVDPDHSLPAALKHNLESHDSPLETKHQTLGTIQDLSQELPSGNSWLIQSGFFPLLLRLVFSKQSEDNHKFVEEALVCALNLLPYCNLSPLNMLKEGSKLECFLELFSHGNTAIKKGLCQLVEAVSSSLDTKELCAMLGKNRGLLQGLVLLLQQNSGASEAGIKAISALCSLEPNQENLVKEGVVDGLITYILCSERHSGSLAPMAVAILEVLLGLEGGKRAVIDHPRGVNALVKMVFRVSDHEGSESAVESLSIICAESDQARERAICAGVLTQLLLLIQSQCRGRAKTKARMLLKLLRKMWTNGLGSR